MAELTVKYLSDSLTDQEREELSQLLASSPENKKLFEEIIDPKYIIPEAFELGEYKKERTWERIEQSVFKNLKTAYIGKSIETSSTNNLTDPTSACKHTNFKFIWKFISAAVVIIILFAVLLYIYAKEKHAEIVTTTPGSTSTRNSIKNTSYIKRKDKPLVLLDTVQNGILGYLENQKNPIIKHDSEVIYPKVRKSDLEYIMTKGDGYFQFTLPDGSKVWLCGTSSVHISNNFLEGAQRNITFDGIGYFEISPDPSKPFLVQTNRIDIEVIGTKFNINSSDNEDLFKTNLFEGKIRLKMPGKDTLISAGEQVIIKKSKQRLSDVVKIFKNKANGFENSFIVFNKEDLETALREIAKYYDHEIKFVKPIPKRMLVVKLYRQQPLDQILQYISNIAGIKLRIKGRTVLVTP
jgi:hypothetical protein